MGFFIGRDREARRAYGFDEIALVPGSITINPEEVEVSTYPLFQYPPYDLALASRMSEVAQSYKLDLLHVHYAIPHSIAALLAQQMSHRWLPFITTLHGTDITLVGVDRSYFPITRFSIEQSDGITAVSQYLKERTIEVFGTRKEIHVIRNFVNCNIYRPNPEHRRKRKTLYWYLTGLLFLLRRMYSVGKGFMHAP